MPLNLSQDGKKVEIENTPVRHGIEMYRSLLQSILDNAVHIGGTDYRIGEREIEKIKEILKSK